MQLKIDRLNRKVVNTSRGDSESVSILSGGVWYNAWAGQWNDGWKQGDTITVSESQLEIKNSNGKEYRNLKAPPKDSGGGAGSPAAGGDVMEALRHIYKKLEAIEKDLVAIKGNLGVPDENSW